MKLFGAIIILVLSLSLATACQDSDDSGASLTFVIVHGATGGGWDWKTVDRKLSAKGHTVYRPTLTGLGEKHHLINADVDLTTHIDDVVNTIMFEQLESVILVGHSYGGMVITGVMDSIPEKIRHVTFLDAFVPDDGMSAMDVLGQLPPETEIRDGVVYFPWLNADAEVPKDVPHPYESITEPVSYDNKLAHGIDVSYVAFVPPGLTAKQRSDDPSWDRAEQRGWTMRTFDGDHVIYRQKPDEMAKLLIEAVSDTNSVE